MRLYMGNATVMIGLVWSPMQCAPLSRARWTHAVARAFPIPLPRMDGRTTRRARCFKREMHSCQDTASWEVTQDEGLAGRRDERAR